MLDVYQRVKRTTLVVEPVVRMVGVRSIDPRISGLHVSTLRLGSTSERFVRYLPQARRVTFTQAVGQVSAEVDQLELRM